MNKGHILDIYDCDPAEEAVLFPSQTEAIREPLFAEQEDDSAIPGKLLGAWLTWLFLSLGMFFVFLVYGERYVSAYTLLGSLCTGFFLLVVVLVRLGTAPEEESGGWLSALFLGQFAVIGFLGVWCLLSSSLMPGVTGRLVNLAYTEGGRQAIFQELEARHGGVRRGGQVELVGRMPTELLERIALATLRNGN